MLRRGGYGNNGGNNNNNHSEDCQLFHRNNACERKNNPYEYKVPDSCTIVGEISTRGIAYGCKVIQGPRGGQYYINNFGNPTHVGNIKKHQVVYYDKK